ncbi:MAG: hypothetical protein ACTSXC_07160 [Candidatus Freyarchaeota archaeon]
MGFSVTLSEIVILTAALVLASSFSAYALYAGNLLQNNIARAIDGARRRINVRVEIAYATISEDGGRHFVIYSKNTGNLPISTFDSIDLYVGEYLKAELYRYSSSGGTGYFNITDSDNDGVWEPGETAILRAYNGTSIEASLYEVKIYISNGVGDDYLFPPPP